MNDDMLINLVEQYPQLYNKTMWEYKDNNKKKEIWKTIAKEVGSTDEFCIKRWTALRERYGRILNQSKAASGSGATAEIKWQHFEHLNFLRGHMGSKKQRSNFNNEESQKTTTSEVCAFDAVYPESESNRLSPSHLDSLFSPIEAIPSPSQPSTSTPSQSRNSTPFKSSTSRQNKRKAESDSDTAAFCEVSKSLKTYLETPEPSVKDPQAHSFGQFVEHSLEDMAPLKKLRVIADITNLLLAAQMEEN